MSKELGIDVRQNGRMTSIHLTGHFGHAGTHSFRTAVMRCLNDEASEVVIDCGGLVYIDSLAMGALVLCRNAVLQKGRTIALANCHGPVQEALRLGNFHKIFEIR